MSLVALSFMLTAWAGISTLAGWCLMRILLKK